MVDWAEQFDVPILLHADDAEHVVRPSPRIEHWTGERRALWDGLELLRLGGHFAGGTVLPVAGRRRRARRAAHRRHRADRRRTPTGRASCGAFPTSSRCPPREVERIRAAIAPLAFDRAYGAFWPGVMDGDAHAKVLRSADRYLAALSR